ncbi:hypothetical protein DSO57_1014554 [Entomophthora muscae]|uniref:Uncharacterized protein n=1 Tax=Entomophthora muscae TaxID=34485 RepID=A0ACC2SU73_9FUNG|nr:hypothetical protein DSO57_1014554 [Entomophthora muscae]
MRNEYGYVPKGSNVGVAWCAAVRATAYSMVALLGPKGVELYQMILGSHNSRTFLSFLQLVQEHLSHTSPGFTNVIVLDNVGLRGNCGRVDSLKLDSLVLDTLSSTRELSAAYVNLLVFLA